MPNEQLTSYVAGERARGVSDDAIRQELVAKGWHPEDIASALGSPMGQSAGFSFRNLFRGRIGRMQYFIANIILATVFFLTHIPSLMSAFSFGSGSGNGGVFFLFIIVMLALYVAGIVLQLSLVIRRLHDIGMSGWLCIIIFIPLINLAWALYILFKRGEGVPNKYGPVPGPRNYLKVLLNTQ